jgi:hypothetical protein
VRPSATRCGALQPVEHVGVRLGRHGHLAVAAQAHATA